MKRVELKTNERLSNVEPTPGEWVFGVYSKTMPDGNKTTQAVLATVALDSYRRAGKVTLREITPTPTKSDMAIIGHAAELWQVVKKLQWVTPRDGGPKHCPFCKAPEEKGMHRKNCIINNVMEDVEGSAE